jgi:hypothetical protein
MDERRHRDMRFIFAFFSDLDFRAILFSFTGTDPGVRGVCADVAV